MMELIAQNMAPIMFVSLIGFLLFGYPVAFALAANGLLFFFVGVELAPLSGGSINLSWNLLQAMPERLWGVLSNETLLAIPFFTFMGVILEKSGMAEDLLATVGQLFGHARGDVPAPARHGADRLDDLLRVAFLVQVAGGALAQQGGGDDGCQRTRDDRGDLVTQ